MEENSTEAYEKEAELSGGATWEPFSLDEDADIVAQDEQRLKMQQAEAAINEHLKEIGTLDPSIRTLRDLTKKPYYPEFYERVVKRGMTLVEAYKLTNYDTLINGAAKKRSVPDDISVPDDVMEFYRALLPEVSDDEFQAHYNRSRKKK